MGTGFTASLISTIDPARRPALLEHIKADIDWWQKEIDDNPNHPTNLYFEREISKLRELLKAYQPTDT